MQKCRPKIAHCQPFTPFRFSLPDGHD